MRRKGILHLRSSAFICGFGILYIIIGAETSAPGVNFD
jgi:hypothetical protein